MKMSDERLARIRSGAAEHSERYVSTDGAEGYLYKGVPILVLTTTGRRTGASRSTPLIFGRAGDAFVVIASLGGADEHPGWFRNLAADPLAVVQVKDERVAIVAHIAEADERARLWTLMVELYPAYAEYQSRTARELPVIRLDRR